MSVTQIESNSFIGKCLLGKVHSGSLRVGEKVRIIRPDGSMVDGGKVTKLLSRVGLNQVEKSKNYFLENN